MFRAPYRGIRILIWIFVLVFGGFHKPISAQEGNQVRLAPVNLQQFPTISSVLEVRSPSGEFIHGIQQKDVHIIEDGKRLSLTELQPLRTGVQFVLAVSPGPAFEIRDVQGVSRYEYLSQALQDWVEARQGSTVDDLSLIIADGPETTHQTDINRWAASFQSFEPTGEETGPDFDVLTRALDVAGDQTSTPGMASAVLFITPLPAQDVALGLQSLADRANQQGVSIFVWLVASSEQFFSSEAEQLRLLAEQTGGEMFSYSGQEIIPSPEDFLEEFRDVYSITYSSQISTSGLHQISAEVNLQGQNINSPVEEIELEVLPPSIAFISPPVEINRTVINPESDSPSLAPDTQTLELLIEFPDGYSRPILATNLSVDGVVEQVHHEEPFDRLIWDISGYTTSGEHILLVEVEDSLGLKGQSVETSIIVTVGEKGKSFIGAVTESRVIMAVVLAVVSGVAVLFVLVWVGKLKPGILMNVRRRKKQKRTPTQPLQADQEAKSQSRSTWINRIQWSRSPITIKPEAQFIPITDTNSENSHPPLAIIKDKVFFGKDENQVDQVLKNNSIEDVHANLKRDAKDTYWLYDMGSTAGTWVNYRPVPPEGQILEHGDIVHFGRLGFRFILRNPKKVRKPVLRFENKE
ncbi:MAG: FHA domain-containing protein [Anaerolineales bacterium]